MQLLRQRAAVADRLSRETLRKRVQEQRKSLSVRQALLEEERQFCARCLQVRFQFEDDKRTCADCFKKASLKSARERHALPAEKPSEPIGKSCCMSQKRVTAEEEVVRLSNDLVFGSSTEERLRALWALDKARHVLESRPFNRAPLPRSG